MSLQPKCPACGAELSLTEDTAPTATDIRPLAAGDSTVIETAGVGAPKPPAEAKASTSLEVFGDYEIIEEIAQGGMGIVYKARQRSLNRLVALKMVLSERLAGESGVKRFLIEAQAAAKLQHPGIVAIHDVGTVRGQHFYSMDYVMGQTLAQLVREHPLPARKAAEYVRKISQAIHYAHSQDVLHRDLKPGNVMIDYNDDPRVMDFGLAKILNSDSGQTLSGTVMGTASYMSPEQASGHNDRLDARSDVYSLGAILYELLTGAPPFRGETTVATLKLLIETDPVPPAQSNPKIPADLQTICLKAIEKEPAKRYSSAAALAEDLRRFLQHEPITARPVGAGGKLWRWCKRKPALAAVGSIALISLLTVAIGSPIVAYNLRQRLAEARHSAYMADMSSIQDAIDRGQLEYARQLLDLHRPNRGEPDIRNWEWRYFWQLCQGNDTTALSRHQQTVYFCVASRNARWVASSASNGEVKLWDMDAKREVLKFETGSSPSPAFSPNDEIFASAVSSGEVRLWRTDGLHELPSIKTGGQVQALSFDAEGERIITFAGSLIRYWDIASQALVKEVQAVSGAVVAHTGDWKTLAASEARASHVTLWNEEGGVIWNRSYGHIDTGGRLIKMAFSPDGKWLALALASTPGGGWTIEVIDAKTGDKVVGLPMGSDSTAIMAISFSPDGKLLASAGTDQTIRLWDTQSWSARNPLKGHRVVVVSFLADGKKLLSGGADGQVRLWSADDGRQTLNRFDLDPKFWPELASSRRGGISADNSLFFIVSPDGETVLVDPFRAEIHPKAKLPFKDSRRISVGARAALAALGREKGRVTLWDTAAGTIVADFNLSQEQSVDAITYSANGKWLAARGNKGVFSLWDVPARKEVESWRDSLDQPNALLFSPNSEILATGLKDGRILIWEVASRRQLGTLAGHKNGILLMDFAANGKRLATTSYDGTGRVWDLENFSNIATISGAKNVFFHPVLSPDGSRLFLDEWGTASLFDVQSQRCVARLVTGFPKFLSADMVLGMSQNQVWHWKPPSLQEIDTKERPPLN